MAATVLANTSSLGGVGKTTTSVNSAVALAIMGKIEVTLSPASIEFLKNEYVRVIRNIADIAPNQARYTSVQNRQEQHLIADNPIRTPEKESR